MKKKCSHVLELFFNKFCFYFFSNKFALNERSKPDSETPTSVWGGQRARSYRIAMQRQQRKHSSERRLTA